MKKAYGNYIESQLKQIIPTKFPCFKYLKKQKNYGLDYNFICEDKQSIKMISIKNSHDENAFMIEVFWSIDGSKFQNDRTHIWFEDDDDILEIICDTDGKSLRIGLPVFYAFEFESWWAIDPTGGIIKSIQKNGFISADAYSKFYSEDTFTSDESNLSEEEMKIYIVPLIDNAVNMIKKYAIPLFECRDKNLSNILL